MDSLTSSVLYNKQEFTTPIERKLDKIIELSENNPKPKSSEDLTVNVKYFNSDLPKLEKLEKNDWIDVRVNKITMMAYVQYLYSELSENDKRFGFKEVGEVELYEKFKKIPFEYEAFQFMYLHLGFALQLPEGYEGYLKLRSGTFKNFGFIQVNGVGTVDESYCGNNDEWIVPVLSIFPGQIYWGNRVGQFRIQTHSPKIEFNEVNNLHTESRGGLGSTGLS